MVDPIKVNTPQSHEQPVVSDPSKTPATPKDVTVSITNGDLLANLTSATKGDEPNQAANLEQIKQSVLNDTYQINFDNLTENLLQEFGDKN